MRRRVPPPILYVGEGERVARGKHRYVTTIDRVGYALAAGAGLGGAVTMVLALFGGALDPLQLLVALFGGALIAAFAIVAVATPVWLALHLLGWRQPALAALLGALIALLIFLAGQTYGLGMAMPVMDQRALTYRWISAAGTSALVALLAAGVGLVMWRIAYRRAI